MIGWQGERLYDVNSPHLNYDLLFQYQIVHSHLQVQILRVCVRMCAADGRKLGGNV